MSNKKYIYVNVDGLPLDLPDDNINLQLTFKNPCSGDFGTISGNKSERSFNLPSTKQNDQVFTNWWKVNQDNPQAVEEKEAAIQVNGLNVLTGKAQLKDVTTQGRFYERQGKEYQVAFFGSNADWFEQLKDLKLGLDLDWSAQQHRLSNTTITAAYNAAPVDVYGYAVLKFQDWAASTKVDVYESTPVLFIGEVLKKIFNSIGYTINSGFWANPVNERYVLPVPLNIRKYPQEFSEDYLNVAATFTAPPSAPQNIAGANTLNGVFLDTQTQTPPLAAVNPFVLSTPSTVQVGAGNTGQYTAPIAGFYQIKMTITVDNITGPTTLLFSPLGSGGNVTLSGGGTALTVLDNGNSYSVDVIAQLETGGVIEFYALVNNSETLDITNVNIEIIGDARISPNGLIDFKYLLRDWKITDFIKGLTAAFNLCFETDVDLKTVTIEPSDDYLVTNRAASGSVVLDGFHIDNQNDFSPKLDFEKTGKVKALNEISEKQQYNWKQDSSDKTAEAANANEELTFDASRYDLPLNRFKGATDENENPFFAPTIMFFDGDIRAETSTENPLIPMLWPDNYRENPTAQQNETDFEPRILWFGGQRNLDGQINIIDSLTAIESTIFLPACFFVNYNDPTGLDVSLNWSTLDINGNTVQGHLQKFYLQHSARQRQGKEVQEWIYFDELDISQLSFRNKIFINGTMYILKEVNSYSPIADGSTKAVLTYDVVAEQEDINRINNTLAVGFIGNYENPE